MAGTPRPMPQISPARIAWLRRLLSLLQLASPSLAARLAFSLFLRPQRRELQTADAATMAAARVHLLTAGTDQVQVYEWGAGPRTVVILHGWGSRASRFAPLATALVSRGWRVLALDAPAHGLSPGVSSSLPQFMQALTAVATQLGPVQALIGHSLGALTIACQHPPGPPAWFGDLRRVVLISMPGGAPFLVDAFGHMFAIREPTARRMLALFRQRFDAAPQAYVATADTPPLRLPVLLVHDQGDDIVPFAHSQKLLSGLPRAQLLATDGLGHSALTRDADTIDAIIAFLDAEDQPALVQVRPADLQSEADAAAIVLLISAYAMDPRGGGQPLPAAVQSRLVPGLRAHPLARVWLAFDGTNAVGVCVAFIGYSTFQARPLLNIHDLAVLAGQRGRGIGRALLAAAEAGAAREGCCKLTLEVQDDNTPARQLYGNYGFHDVRYGNSGPTRFLAKPL
jgi:pimeloyl-ACP methyl ester carboxylesterase/GNAT superfamily N-acetyltransferase